MLGDYRRVVDLLAHHSTRNERREVVRGGQCRGAMVGGRPRGELPVFGHVRSCWPARGSRCDADGREGAFWYKREASGRGSQGG